MTSLADFTTDQLLDEIVRRRNGQEGAQPIADWCDDCAHFKYSKNESDTANNCQKGHTMQFRMPPDWPDADDYGFFRRGCPDGMVRPVPVEPPPPRSTPKGVPR